MHIFKVIMLGMIIIITCEMLLKLAANCFLSLLIKGYKLCIPRQNIYL